MAQRTKTLQQQVDELRGELAALQAERAREAVAPKARKSAAERATEVEAATENLFETARETAEEAMSSAASTASATLGDLEKALTGFLELTEAEIAEHPTLAAGLAFLAGVAVGRMSKG